MACHRSICRVFSSAHDGIVALCVYTCTRKDKMLSGVPAGIFAFLRLIHSRVATDLISLCFAESFELSFFPAPLLKHSLNRKGPRLDNNVHQKDFTLILCPTGNLDRVALMM